jgi:hypothetical protein
MAFDPRGYILAPKTIETSTNWSMGDLPPRWSIFPRTKPMANGWEWSALRLDTAAGPMTLLFQANEVRGNWKAWLLGDVDGARLAIARLEQHAGAGEDLHLHTQCGADDLVFGPESLAAAGHRTPGGDGDARRLTAWTRPTFRDYSCMVFRVDQTPMPEDPNQLVLQI